MGAVRLLPRDPPSPTDPGVDPVAAAVSLLGWVLHSDVDGVATAVRITEVEAYGGEDDPASHAHRGPTRANRSMFGPAGTLYVYRAYGLHWCANVVSGPTGVGSAVLIRAGDPLAGEPAMVGRRGRDDRLVDGPGKLCQALGITGDHDGLDLAAGGVIRLEPGPPPGSVVSGPRVGISRATDRPWRFRAG